jgi:hypothetical protein
MSATYLGGVSGRLVVQGVVAMLLGSAVLLTARRLARDAVPRSWPEPFGRRFDGPNPLRNLTWSYQAFGVGALILGFVWVLHGLT